MSTTKLSGLMGHLGHGDPNGLRSTGDGELLNLFIATRNEEAFTELVRRHSGLVLGVCRRVTGNHHLAEDAFQAVFVVLATKAGAVRPPSAVAAWLHGVAWRTAMRARTMSDRRRRREAVVSALPESIPHESVEMSDALAILDEEIARLPEHYRLPLVLCELEGQCRKDVAGKLRIPEGTLSSRLAAARKRLADRLSQRGIALSIAGLTAVLTRATSAQASIALIAKTAITATRGTIPAHVATLSQGVLRIMFLNKLKTTVPLALMAAGLLVYAAVAAVPPSEPPEPPGTATAKPLLFVAAHADPPPGKVEPKPLPKGPNKLLFYQSGFLNTIDPDGKNETKLNEERSRMHPATLRFSPDSKYVAFTVFPNREPGDKQPIRNPKGKLHVRELTEKGLGTDLDIFCETFAWSADGSLIAASERTEETDKQRIAAHHLVDVKTKEKKTLKLPDNHIVRDWTPDGKYLLTTSLVLKDDKRINRIHLMHLDGTEHKALTDEKANASGGRISPDGTRVLCTIPSPKEKQTPLRSDLYVLHIDTGKLTPVPLKDSVFAIAFKVYSTVSSRRFQTDLNDAVEKGHMSRTISWQKVSDLMENEAMTPILKELIGYSARPLRSVDTSFAIDSSGFSANKFERFYDHKHGTTRFKHAWVKVHIACGTKTNVVSAVRILDKDAADCPQFVPLVRETKKHFTIGEVSADKAYASLENFEEIAGCNGQAYIAFKSNHTGAVGGLSCDKRGNAEERPRWVSCRKGFFLPVRVLSRVFRGKYLDGLRKLFAAGQLNLSGRWQALTDPQAFACFLTPLYRKDWVVYAKRPFGGPQQVLKYLARYTHRVAISNSRLVDVADGRVTFRYKDYADANQSKTMTLSADEFLRRFVQHVLPKGFVKIRHYGLLANRCREECLALCRRLLLVETVRAELSEGVTEVGGEAASMIRSCPHCGSQRIFCLALPSTKGNDVSAPLVASTACDTS